MAVSCAGLVQTLLFEEKNREYHFMVKYLNVTFWRNIKRDHSPSLPTPLPIPSLPSLEAFTARLFLHLLPSSRLLSVYEWGSVQNH